VTLASECILERRFKSLPLNEKNTAMIITMIATTTTTPMAAPSGIPAGEARAAANEVAVFVVVTVTGIPGVMVITCSFSPVDVFSRLTDVPVRLSVECVGGGLGGDGNGVCKVDLGGESVWVWEVSPMEVGIAENTEVRSGTIVAMPIGPT